jgi:hypothetical protein
MTTTALLTYLCKAELQCDLILLEFERASLNITESGENHPDMNRVRGLMPHHFLR